MYGSSFFLFRSRNPSTRLRQSVVAYSYAGQASSGRANGLNFLFSFFKPFATLIALIIYRAL
jgi:hypothetical protein